MGIGREREGGRGEVSIPALDPRGKEKGGKRKGRERS